MGAAPTPGGRSQDWPACSVVTWPCRSTSPQRKTARPGSAHPAASKAFSLFTVGMLQQNLREKELGARHQAELQRLRQMVLEEKARAELAGRQHK